MPQFWVRGREGEVRDEVISPGFPPSLVHLSSMLTHERKVAQQSFRGDVYGRLRAVRESKQSFSQGGVLSYIWHHLTKHDASPLIRRRIRPQQMHSEAGSAHCLDYNFRTKLKAHIFSLSLCQEIREVRKLSRYTDNWQTAEIWAKMSDLPRLGSMGSMFYFLSSTVTPEQPNQPRGWLDSKHSLEVLVPQLLPCFYPLVPQAYADWDRVGTGQSITVGRGQGSMPREVSERPLCLAPTAHWDSQSHLLHWDKQGTWVRKKQTNKKTLALFCKTTRPGVWRVRNYD